MDKKIKNSGQLIQGIEFLQKRIKELERSDIERKKAEEDLRASLDRYRSYIELTGQLEWTTNADGEVVEDIPSWRKYTGQGYEDVKGRGWSGALHPDDIKHTLEAWKKAVAAKSSYEVEYRIRRYDGVYCYFMARGIPVFKEDGNIREWVGTCIDITERKAAQERLRMALHDWDRTFNSISDPVLIVDKESIIVKANAAFAESLNIKPEDMLGKKSCEVLHRSNPSWPNCPFEMAKKDKLPHMQEIFDSNIGIPLLVTASPILDDQGEVAGGVLHIKDIVKIKERIEKFIR